MKRYNEFPTGVTSRTHVVNKMINIPALYWVDMGGIKTQWWMTKDHSNAIKKLSVDEMKNTMLYGKVLHKGKSNCYEVALMIYESNDEVSIMIHAKPKQEKLQNAVGTEKPRQFPTCVHIPYYKTKK